MSIFVSDDLKKAIHNDISVAKHELDKDSMLKHREDKFFANLSGKDHKSTNNSL